MPRFTILLVLLGTACSAFASRPTFAHRLQDTIPPAILCPPDITLALSGTACDTTFTYTVTAEDDQPGVVVARVFGIASGGVFPAGTTTNMFIAVDASGNTATCSFTVTVSSNPPSSLSCKSSVNIPLNSACQAVVRADALLNPPFACNDAYDVEVDRTLPFGNGPWEQAIFGPGDLGKTYQYRVTNKSNGNKCWGDIKLIDTLPGTVVCADLMLPCALPSNHLQPTFLRDSLGIAQGFPTATDNCPGNLALSFSETSADVPCGDPNGITATISRIWTATDVSNNKASCLQLVHRVRTLDFVQFPENTDVYCSEPDAPPTRTGAPFAEVGGRRYNLTTAPVCELDVFYSDSIEATCGGGWRIRRVWDVRDACLPVGPDNPVFGTQYIEVRDTTSPVALCPSDTVLVLVADSCRASVHLPDVVVDDACSTMAEAVAFWTDGGTGKVLSGTLNSDTLAVFGLVPDFPVGITEMLYVLTDACGNTATCFFQIEVWDNEPPTAVCDSLLTVYLDGSGQGVLPAVWANNGSIDACGALFFKTRRTVPAPDCAAGTPDFSDDLVFCCSESGDTIAAVLRVYDVPLPPGAVSDTFAPGQFADCAFQVVVSDTLGAACVSPPDVQTVCNDFVPDLTAYGAFEYSCRADSLVETVDYAQFDTLCRRGVIVRQLQVFETASGQSTTCVQTIAVDTLPQHYYIRFPDDRIITQCDTMSQYGEPLLFGTGCEQLVATYTDEILTIVPDACIRIDRTWTVRNACTYDPNLPLVQVPNPNPNTTTNHPNNLPGPVVSPVNTEAPWAPTVVAIAPGNPPTNFSVFWSAQANGYTYKQTIKILDTQKPLVADCPAAPSILEDASSNDQFFWNAQYWYDPLSGQHDMCEGEVDLCLTATDFCAGSNVDIRYLLFLDLNGDGTQETVVNSTRPFEANRVNFNNAPNPNYSGGTPREFDFRLVPANQKYGFSLQTLANGRDKIACVRWRTVNEPLNFVKPQLPYGTHRIRWFVTDQCGNETTCEQTFTVQNSAGICDAGEVLISGAVLTETGNPVADVTVALTRIQGNQPPWSGTTLTDNTGNYALPILSGGHYTVRPERNSDPLNGVTTLDLLLINKHILGADTLNSPYKLIAADANNSRSVTTFDVVELRKLILGVYSELPNNTAWRFVDADYEFLSPTPFAFPFPEFASGSNPSPLNPPIHNFVAVKVGDVNNSASLDGSAVETRTQGAAALTATDRVFAAGEVFDVAVSVDEVVTGCQFALALAGLEVLDVLPEAGMGHEHVAWFPETGRLAVSWDGPAARPAVVLRLRAEAAGRLSDFMRLWPAQEPRPEVYRSDAEGYRTLGIALRFDRAADAHTPMGIELFQNRPNPFGVQTEIGFYLPEAGTATLRVFDATGRERYAHTATYPSGLHRVVLAKAELGGSGVFYYALETAGVRLARRMVAVEHR